MRRTDCAIRQINDRVFERRKKLRQDSSAKLDPIAKRLAERLNPVIRRKQQIAIVQSVRKIERKNGRGFQLAALCPLQHSFSSVPIRTDQTANA